MQTGLVRAALLLRACRLVFLVLFSFSACRHLLVCGGGPYYAHDILPWYLQYLQMKGMTGRTEASSRHLSSQLKKYPRFIMRVREPRRAGGQRFVLEGHPTFEFIATSRAAGKRRRGTE